jgi:hypothetical protein
VLYNPVSCKYYIHIYGGTFKMQKFHPHLVYNDPKLWRLAPIDLQAVKYNLYRRLEYSKFRASPHNNPYDAKT